MGLDQHIYMVKNKKQFDSDDFWKICEDVSGATETFEYNRPAELWYNRKNWPLHAMLTKEFDLENGEYIELDLDHLEKILHFLTHTPDYFNGFDSVRDICKIIQNYQLIKDNGFSIFYEGDY